MESFSIERSYDYRHTLWLVFVTNQGFDNCDLVEDVDWLFAVDKDDGQITNDFILRHQFNPELINGALQECKN